MKSELIRSLNEGFEEKAQKQDGFEFWYARDLSVIPVKTGIQSGNLKAPFIRKQII